MTIDLPTFFVRQRILLLALSLAMGVLVAFGISNTEQDNSPDAILAQNDPYKAEIDQNRADFPGSPTFIFAFAVSYTHLRAHET